MVGVVGLGRGVGVGVDAGCSDRKEEINTRWYATGWSGMVQIESNGIYEL
jgi:hypothetical protein